MKTLLKRYYNLMTITLMILLFGCVEENFDLPPETTIPVGEKYTIEQLKNLAGSDEYVFEDSASVYGVVTMDDKLGNIYKTAYIQDSTGGIALHMSASGGIYRGDSVRIFLKGLKIGTYNDLYQIDAPDGEGFELDEHTIKLNTNIEVEPELITIDEISARRDELQAKLVKLENVQFISEDTAKTFADTSEDRLSRNTYLIDNSGKTMIVRTSGYANFADESVPNKNGSVIAIVSQYRNEMQLLIRDTEELEMNNPRFLAEVTNFNDNSFGNWTTYSVTGDQEWNLNNQGSDTYYANMSGYDNGHNENEDWLISPAFNLDNYKNETFSFMNACNYSGPVMEVKISTNYSGEGNPKNAAWADLTGYSLSDGGFNWVFSGEIDLSGYLGENVHVAFVYKSTNSAGKTWEVDDITLMGNKK